MIMCEGELGKDELRFVGLSINQMQLPIIYICAGKSSLNTGHSWRVMLYG